MANLLAGRLERPRREQVLLRWPRRLMQISQLLAEGP